MSAPVLVLNIGSSTVKYELLDGRSGERHAEGLAERLGEGEGLLTHTAGDGARSVKRLERPDHETAMAAILDAFAEWGPDLSRITLTAVGHRVVHGGSRFSAPVLIDDRVVKAIEELVPLAPLHNPANLVGIRIARRIFPGVPQVAVFDTAFHQNMPPAAYTYAVPPDWITEHGVRRYGFHGTSYAYVSRRAAHLLGRPPESTRLIVFHLGNGASAAAIDGGRSVDTSMGMTPLEGLVMGTRSGDLDPAIPAYLCRSAGLTPEAVDRALSRESGLLGLAGAGDMREVRRRAAQGDPAAVLALEVYRHRIRKYAGAYFAVLGRVDAIVFTGGVGENDADTREKSLAGLERLGVAVDPERNRAPGPAEREISPAGAETAVLVVPTDEEREIALQACELLGSG
ncbi:acetate/propionate family kinase [Rhizohabitans arisaemae]|uniref:acetate/propionate family kinase n=1 Tax=Rhizohabitans arisaemae TaxID=2720610 RepID=UPI0024B15C31|nr:acetate kinase [Rhizohabitans arisaemae]